MKLSEAILLAEMVKTMRELVREEGFYIGDDFNLSNLEPPELHNLGLLWQAYLEEIDVTNRN